MCNDRERAGASPLSYLESSSMCNDRERAGASPPSLPGIFFHVQPTRGGGKPTLLTWNLLPCVTTASGRGQAHLTYLESSSMCNDGERAGASPPSLP